MAGSLRGPVTPSSPEAGIVGLGNPSVGWLRPRVRFSIVAKQGSIRSLLSSVALNDTAVIKSFRHKGLQLFFETGSKAGIQPKHAPRLSRQLGRLDQCSAPQDMNLPGWDLHELEGSAKGTWAVSVNANWRLTFEFDETDAVGVNYVDYH